MKKKICLIILILVFVVSFLLIFMNSKINAGFTIKKVFYNSHSFFSYDIENEDEFVEIMTNDYNISERQAKAIFDNPGDYVKVTLDYTIENNSLLPMYVVRPLFSNTSNVFVNIEKPESQAICYIPAKECSVFGTDIIVKKNEFNNTFLEKLKITVLSIGIKVLCNIPFSGYENITDMVEWDEEYITSFPEGFVEEKYYYQPINNTDEKYNLNLYNDLSSNYSRVISGGTYTVNRFICNQNNYCGVAFFDTNGVFKGGMAIHTIFADKTLFAFCVGKSTFEDVRNVDSGCLLFEYDDQMKSYHYFSDETCLIICYTKDGVISSIDEISVADLFERLLIDDATYILNRSKPLKKSD